MAVPARVGRYEVALVLGHGAVGRVCLARDPDLGRQVAVKIVRDDLDPPAETAQAMAQIREGARAAATLSHPAIAALHDIGEEAKVGVYVVSEFVKGPTFRERIARGRLSRAEVAALSRTLGYALSYAHAQGVIHGNFKPENVLLSPTGPKIVDFALPGWLARSNVNVEEAPPLPDRGAPEMQDYRAPEVFASGVPSARGDQYSLAAALYEALTARRFTGAIASWAAAGSAGKLRPPPGIWPELGGEAHLDAIFDRALASDPRRRFPSCEVFAESLADALDAAQGTLPAPNASQSSIVPRSTRRWQNAVAGAAVLVIFGLVGLGGARHGATEGISLKSVAHSFSRTFAPGHAPSNGPMGAPPWERARLAPLAASPAGPGTRAAPPATAGASVTAAPSAAFPPAPAP